MTNKDIRRRAWELCRENFWRLLGASLFISLVTSLFAAPYVVTATQAASAQTFGGGIFAFALLSILLLMLAALVLEAGLLQYISNLWLGEPAGIGTLFVHTRRVLRLLGIAFLTALLMFAVMLPAMLVMVFLANFAEIITIILMFTLIFFIFYAALRLTPTMTAFILNPEQSAWSCIKDAWRAGKGNVRRIFCHMFMLALPMYAATILISLLTPATGAYNSALANAIVSIATLLITTLFSTYMQIGQYGLNEQLLNNHYIRTHAISVAELWGDTPAISAEDPEESQDPNHP